MTLDERAALVVSDYLSATTFECDGDLLRRLIGNALRGAASEAIAEERERAAAIVCDLAGDYGGVVARDLEEAAGKIRDGEPA